MAKKRTYEDENQIYFIVNHTEINVIVPGLEKPDDESAEEPVEDSLSEDEKEEEYEPDPVLAYLDILDYNTLLLRLMDLIGNDIQASSLRDELKLRPQRKDLRQKLDKYYHGSMQQLENAVRRNRDAIPRCFAEIINWHSTFGYDVGYSYEEVIDQLKNPHRRQTYRRWLRSNKGGWQSLPALNDRYKNMREQTARRRSII